MGYLERRHENCEACKEPTDLCICDHPPPPPEAQRPKCADCRVKLAEVRSVCMVCYTTRRRDGTLDELPPPLPLGVRNRSSRHVEIPTVFTGLTVRYGVTAKVTITGVHTDADLSHCPDLIARAAREAVRKAREERTKRRRRRR